MKPCETKYPVLLVHGMGFRDRKQLNYWGRIPDVLRKNGAEIYYGYQDANASVEDNAQMLKLSLDKALMLSKADKVNIIAHSKGGLESRYLISTLGQADKVASLSTISTPHNGSETVDKLLKFPDFLVKAAAKITDFFMWICGDRSSDTYRVFYQLTTDFAEKFNAENPDSENVYYQSFGFYMKNPFSDMFLFIPNFIVNKFEGKNDGLLAERNVRWTNFRGAYTGTGRRGISHCDEVDMRRRKLSRKQPSESHEISDVTNFYFDLVSELRTKGF